MEKLNNIIFLKIVSNFEVKPCVNIVAACSNAPEIEDFNRPALELVNMIHIILLLTVSLFKFQQILPLWHPY